MYFVCKGTTIFSYAQEKNAFWQRKMQFFEEKVWCFAEKVVTLQAE